MRMQPAPLVSIPTHRHLQGPPSPPQSRARSARDPKASTLNPRWTRNLPASMKNRSGRFQIYLAMVCIVKCDIVFKTARPDFQTATVFIETSTLASTAAASSDQVKRSDEGWNELRIAEGEILRLAGADKIAPTRRRPGHDSSKLQQKKAVVEALEKGNAAQQKMHVHFAKLDAIQEMLRGAVQDSKKEALIHRCRINSCFSRLSTRLCKNMTESWG